MITLKLSCSACPEQYDAFDEEGKQVGYLRLRHGFFRVDFPDCGGETIYEVSPRGDGCFDDDERDRYLRFAVDAIERRIRNEAPLPIPPAPDVEYKIEGGPAGFMR